MDGGILAGVLRIRQVAPCRYLEVLGRRGSASWVSATGKVQLDSTIRKTSISIPDATFEGATKRARELGISRSEFFSTAARRYLDELARESLTSQIDQALDLPGSDDDASTAAVWAGRHQLKDQDW